MLKVITLSLFAAVAAAKPAGAVSLPIAAPVADPAIVQVGEGCGPGGWRSGLDNRCRPLGVYVVNPRPGIECPAGWHIGPGRGACWPNR